MIKKIKNKQNLCMITLWTMAAVLSFIKIYAEFSAMQNTKEAIGVSVNQMSYMWKNHTESIFIPSIDFNKPITVESGNIAHNRDLHITASYNPSDSKLMASIDFTDNSDVKKTYYAFCDKSNVGLSVNGLNGTYYTFDVKTLKKAIEKDTPADNRNFIGVFTPKNINYVKAVLKTAESAKNVNVDKNKIKKAAAQLFLNCRFQIPKNVYINTPNGRVRARKFSFRIKTKHIAECIEIVCKDIVSQSKSDIFKSAYNKAYTFLTDVGNEYTECNIIVYEGKVTEAICTFPSYSKKNISVSAIPEYNTGCISLKINYGQSDVEAGDIKLFPSKSGITATYIGNGKNIKCTFASSFIKSSFRSDEKKLSINIDECKNRTYRIEVQHNSGNFSDNTISFKLYNHHISEPSKFVYKPVYDTGFADSINLIKIYDFVNGFKKT